MNYENYVCQTFADPDERCCAPVSLSLAWFAEQHPELSQEELEDLFYFCTDGPRSAAAVFNFDEEVFA